MSLETEGSVAEKKTAWACSMRSSARHVEQSERSELRRVERPERSVLRRILENDSECLVEQVVNSSVQAMYQDATTCNV